MRAASYELSKTANDADTQIPREGTSLEKSENRKTPSVLLSRTTTNQNSRNALKSLAEHEMLAEFWTTFAWSPECFWNMFLPGPLRRQLARRSVPEAPSQRIKGVPWRELVRLGIRGTPLQRLLCSAERPFSSAGVGAHFDRQVARRIRSLRPDIVYAFDGAAVSTFREARKFGILTVREQTSSYWGWMRDLIMEEAELQPDFASLLPNPGDFATHVERNDEELRLSDFVLVPSEHILRTLKGIVPKEKIRTIPYGAPDVKPRRNFNDDSRTPLKVLFVGNLGQHKGISYLLKAMELVGSQAELTMIGSRLGPNARVDEACKRWRWLRTLPHSEVLDVMQESDVLVLPSLSDAFGLVVTEALACGLPVIATPNTGASEIVSDGSEGYIIPIRRPDLIASRLETLHCDRTILAEMSRKAQATAAKNSWEHYRANWAHTIRSLPWHSR